MYRQILVIVGYILLTVVVCTFFILNSSKFITGSNLSKFSVVKMDNIQRMNEVSEEMGINNSKNGYGDKSNKLNFKDDDEMISDQAGKPNVLIIIEETVESSSHLGQLRDILNHLRLRHEWRYPTSYFGDLEEQEKLFDIVILLNLESYSQMEYENQAVLKSYCKDHGVGIVVFHWHRGDTKDHDLVPVREYLLNKISAYTINPDCPIWRLTRDGGELTRWLDGAKGWVAFDMSDHRSDIYVPVSMARMAATTRDEYHTVGYLDTGDADGIPKLVLGNNLDFWLHHSMLLDALHFLTKGRITISLKRSVVIDIDDIFPGKHDKIRLNDVFVSIFSLLHRLDVEGRSLTTAYC